MPLLPISGLYALAASKKRQASDLAISAQDRCTTPAEAGQMMERARTLTKEATQHDEHARSNEELVFNIEHLIHYLVHSPHKSASRTLAQRKLEEASGHLRRECGDPPENIINGKHHPHG